eukprot:6186662-Pleurochrysis_carterae.AAC.2
MTLPPSRAAQNEADNSNNLTSDAVDKLSNLAHVAQAGVPAQPVSIPTARSEAVSGVTEGSITSSAARTMAEDVTRQVQLDELIDSKLQCLLSANPDVQRRAIRVLDQISASDLERHLPRITHDLLHHAGARREALRLLLRMRPSRLVDHATLLISLLDANDATVSSLFAPVRLQSGRAHTCAHAHVASRAAVHARRCMQATREIECGSPET